MMSIPGPSGPSFALAEPVFGSSLESLRLYLLTHAPAAFRQRNIFVDASVGAQV